MQYMKSARFSVIIRLKIVRPAFPKCFLTCRRHKPGFPIYAFEATAQGGRICRAANIFGTDKIFPLSENGAAKFL